MISDYMEMTFKKRRKPEKTTNEYDQEYEIMSFVVFRGRKSEMPGIDEKNESVYEEYACWRLIFSMFCDKIIMLFSFWNVVKFLQEKNKIFTNGSKIMIPNDQDQLQYLC